MSAVNARIRPARGVLALTVACGLAIPLGLSAPSSAGPTHQVLLTSTGSVEELATDVALAGGRVVQTYEIAKTLLAELPDAVTLPQGAFAVPNVAMKFNSTPAAPTGSDASNTFKDTIGAPSTGGAGVKVAVVDTGVDPDADITVSDRINVSGGDAGDGLGHGTFMAGLVAGDDATYGGVAPDASVVDVQVATADGSTDLQRVLAGLQAVADKRATDPSLDVLMLALNAGSPLPLYLDPLTLALDRLWDRGVTVVVSAGNDGPDTVSSPATDPQLLVVGAQHEQDTAQRADDVVADFSSYGKSMGIDRPDLVAPGVSLISTSPLASEAYTANSGSVVTTGYLKGTGTSMSAAVAAGAVAALLAQRPSLTPDTAKRLLVGTAYRTPALTSTNGAGAGGLDLGKALTADLSSVGTTGTPAISSPKYGPTESDEATWAAFAAAWVAGDLDAVAAAWGQLTPQTRKWAANAWALASLIRALQSGNDTWSGRKWAGRKWSTQEWDGRKWSEDAWVGRKWSDAQWLASVWDGRKWSGRKWSSTDWLAFAWTARMHAADQELEELYADETGDWEGRKWSAVTWVGRKWSEEAWSGRKWSDYVWDGRKWSVGDWTGRKWSDFAFDGRKWSTELWDGRKWSVVGW